ncbi:hypothetical protein Pelo_8489 [Pelomyxa schiedti]|nr:hypothetical protein Pelo_8489 [Pelomyxa schiedti]
MNASKAETTKPAPSTTTPIKSKSSVHDPNTQQLTPSAFTFAAPSPSIISNTTTPTSITTSTTTLKPTSALNDNPDTPSENGVTPPASTDDKTVGTDSKPTTNSTCTPTPPTQPQPQPQPHTQTQPQPQEQEQEQKQTPTASSTSASAAAPSRTLTMTRSPFNPRAPLPTKHTGAGTAASSLSLEELTNPLTGRWPPPGASSGICHACRERKREVTPCSYCGKNACKSCVAVCDSCSALVCSFCSSPCHNGSTSKVYCGTCGYLFARRG